MNQHTAAEQAARLRHYGLELLKVAADMEADLHGLRPERHPSSGRFVCCGGYGEHFDGCPVGEAILSARRAIAASKVPTIHPDFAPTVAEQRDDLVDAGAFDPEVA